MSTHFYLQYQSQELKDIMQAAVDSKLANRLIHERAKPVKTYGEIRPTDVVPVIAPNSKGTKAAFRCSRDFTCQKATNRLLMPDVRPLRQSPPLRMPGSLTAVLFRHLITTSGNILKVLTERLRQEISISSSRRDRWSPGCAGFTV